MINKKQCSASLVIREIHVKITCFTTNAQELKLKRLKISSVDEDVE